MGIIGEIRRHARSIVPSFLAALTFAYFAYHAVEGDRGLLSWIKLRQEIEAAEVTRVELAAAQATLQRRVTLLRPESLDRDMLEERARAVLNFARPDERVIMLRTELPANGN